MATPADHLAQSEHNLTLYHVLDAPVPQYPDWQVTALFYAALHLVDAYLLHTAPGGARPAGHASRGRQVRLALPALYADYSELQDRSEDARYDLRRLSQQEVHRLFAGELTRPRTAIRTALGVPL